MTTDTLTTRTQVAPRPPQWLRVARWLMGANLFLMACAWTLAVVVIVVVLFAVSRATVPGMSAAGVSHHGMLWFPFSIAVMLTVSYLPLHVANGMTRASFAKASVLVNLVVGALNATVTILALLLEREIYHRLGWFHGETQDSGLEVLHAGVLPYGVGLALMFTSGMLSGLLVGAVYYRMGGWWGTIALPLSLAPLLVTSLIGLDRETQWTPWSVTLGELVPTHNLYAVLVLAASAVAFHLLTRRLPISNSKA
jgi:hypothetical protein